MSAALEPSRVTIELEVADVAVLREWYEHLCVKNEFMTPGLFVQNHLRPALVQGVAIAMRMDRGEPGECRLVRGGGK